MTRYHREHLPRDPDDFMADLLGDSSSSAPLARRSSINHKITQTKARQPAQAKAPKPRLKRSIRIALLASIIIICVGTGMYLLWRGPLGSYLQPKSPFSQEIREKMGIPLYYPTKLPGSFKIELGSISQPEPDVTIYSVSDDDGRRFNITLQRQPANFSLDPLYTALQDVKEVNTKFGTLKLGAAEEMSVANILTGDTWIIISGNPNVLNSTLLAEVVSGLKS